MLRQINHRAVFFFVLAIGALMILASGISKILFVPEPFVLSTSSEEQPVAALGRLRFVGSELIFYVLFALFLLAIISMVLVPEGRVRLMRLILLIAVLYLLSQLLAPRIQTEEQQIVKTETANPIGSNDFQPLMTPQPNLSPNLETPAWLVTAAGIGLALLIVGGIAVIFWLIAHQKSSTMIPEEISLEAQAAVEALEAGGDFQDVILRCYARMSQVLSEQRGVSRDSSMTPHEFERVLIKLGFPSEPIRTITHLFEEVRYGSIRQGENGMQMAISSLNAIIFYCKSLEPI
jgi:hypothetical protein